MNDRQAFKFGFMSHCIERGLTTPAEMLTAVKSASAELEKKSGVSDLGMMAGQVAKGLGNVGSTALSWGIPLALAAPPILGAVGGSLAAKANDTDDFDVNDAKDQEVIDTYRQQAAKLRRQGLIRRHGLSAATTSGRPMF